jgi:hypothetical protein
MTGTKTGWRDILRVHPAALMFPLMWPDKLKELGEDIKRIGMTSPITLAWLERDEEPWLIDGRSRLDALTAVGFEFTRDGPEFINIANGDLAENGEPLLNIRENGEFHDGVVYSFMRDPHAFAKSQNLIRRHLTAQQRREVTDKYLKTKPELSDRAIAKDTGLDHKTVGARRKKLVEGGEIPHHDVRTGSDGVAQPASKPKGTVPLDDPGRPRNRSGMAGLTPEQRKAVEGVASIPGGQGRLDELAPLINAAMAKAEETGAHEDVVESGRLLNEARSIIEGPMEEILPGLLDWVRETWEGGSSMLRLPIEQMCADILARAAEEKKADAASEADAEFAAE